MSFEKESNIYKKEAGESGEEEITGDKERKNPEKISEVEPIEKSAGSLIFNREQIREIVESPLVSACEEFYDKNIQTVSVSANKKDTEQNFANITLDYKSLSEDNKKIAEGFGEISNWGKDIVTIKLPVEKDSTFEDIKNYADSIAHKFLKQKMTWAPRYTLEQLNKYNKEPLDIEYFQKNTGLFYDKDEKVFYQNKEHYKKAHGIEDEEELTKAEGKIEEALREEEN